MDEPKYHHFELVVTFLASEGGAHLRSFFQPHLMIGHIQVSAEKYFAFLSLLKITSILGKENSSCTVSSFSAW
jgi:hypothetical protein